eukprot:scaffold3225_cov105-Isochrysis_galbana.AAC.3
MVSAGETGRGRHNTTTRRHTLFTHTPHHTFRYAAHLLLPRDSSGVQALLGGFVMCPLVKAGERRQLRIFGNWGY